MSRDRPAPVNPSRAAFTSPSNKREHDVGGPARPADVPATMFWGIRTGPFGSSRHAGQNVGAVAGQSSLDNL
jgi:hypothetical protein